MVGLCRLCASVRRREALIVMSVEICQQLRECFALETGQADDILPKWICSNCSHQLQVTYDFYKKVQESQESLSSLFGAKSNIASVEPNNSTHEPAALVENGLTKKLTRLPVSDIVGNVKVDELEVLCETDAIESATCVQQNLRLSITEEEYSAESQQDEDYLIEVYELQNQCNDEPMTKSTYSESDDNEILQKEQRENVYADVNEAIAMDVTTIEHAVDHADIVEDANSSTADECETNILNKNLSHEIVENETTLQLSFVNDKENEEIVEELEELLPVDMKEHLDDAVKLHVAAWVDYVWCCYLCSETAQTPQILYAHVCETHVKTDFSELQYKCMDCQKICLQYNGFLNHIRLKHHGELALRCDVCDAPFENVSQLANHRRKVDCSEVSPLPLVSMCPKCGKCFANENAVQVHARIQHQQEGKCYQCEDCDKAFKRVGTLRAHQRIHTDIKEFTCKLCGRAFRQKANLDVHLYTHITEKNFTCSICDKKFKTSVNLTKHQLIHKEVKRFNCEHCEKQFRTKDAKLSHERIHTGEMPYKCEYCERPFRFRSTLMSHINTHTGERPYSCIECDHHFTNWPNYNKHMKRRHAGKGVDGVAFKKATPRKTRQTRALAIKRAGISANYEEVLEITVINEDGQSQSA